MSVEGEVTMKTFLRRLILETEGQQLIPYTLVGVVVTLIVINADRVAQGLCIAPGFLDSDLKVIISTQLRPGRRSRVALEPGCDSRTSPASTARCTSA